jgi:murein L,D-transpeptidase YafK
MKKILFTLFAVFFISLPLTSKAVDIPSSSRSRAAIFSVETDLKNELQKKGLQYGAPIFIRIFKDSKKLEIWIKNKAHFKLFKTYKICTYGRGGLGPKIRQGDGRAPEGFYYVTPIQINPLSNFHLSFNLGYPNAYDKAHGRTGAALMVHGNCVSIGCYAMTDKNIEEIFALAVASLKKGRGFFRVHIFPFRMTVKNMNKHQRSKWYEFWQNLKEGYDFFENNGNLPPNVTVTDKRYKFNSLP